MLDIKNNKKINIIFLIRFIYQNYQLFFARWFFFFFYVMLIMKYGLGNPLSRLLLRYLVRRGLEGRPAVEDALAVYSGVKKPITISCRFDTTILGLIIKMGALLTGSDEEGFKIYAQDPAVRRGLSLILEGIARYGVTVPQKLPAPFLIVWNFTNACNLRCRHCYQRADKPTPDELSLSEKLRVVADLDAAGVAAIAFSGGEPTIHPHFLRTAREAADRGIYVAVATNGTVITQRYAEKMKRAGVRYVEVSLDSVDPAKHDAFRGVPGAWKRAVRGIRNAVQAGLVTGIATTLTKMNLDEIEDIAELAEELGVQRLIFFNFIPTGRGREIVEWDLTPEERFEALRKIYREATSRDIEIASTAPQFSMVSLIESHGQRISPTHFAMSYDPGILALAEFIGGCGAGRIYAAIQPNGDISPCVFIPLKVGNIRKRTFRDIWENSSTFKLLRNRDVLGEPCRSCPFRNVCGGCRARALSYTGNIMGPDPGCIFARKIYYNIAKVAMKVEREVKVPQELIH